MGWPLREKGIGLKCIPGFRFFGLEKWIMGDHAQGLAQRTMIRRDTLTAPKEQVAQGNGGLYHRLLHGGLVLQG